MEETEPVADFVGDGLAEIEVCGCTAGHGGIEDRAAVVVEVVGAGCYCCWEVAVLFCIVSLLVVKGLVRCDSRERKREYVRRDFLRWSIGSTRLVPCNLPCGELS